MSGISGSSRRAPIVQEPVPEFVRNFKPAAGHENGVWPLSKTVVAKPTSKKEVLQQRRLSEQAPGIIPGRITKSHLNTAEYTELTKQIHNHKPADKHFMLMENMTHGRPPQDGISFDIKLGRWMSDPQAAVGKSLADAIKNKPDASEAEIAAQVRTVIQGKSATAYERATHRRARGRGYALTGLEGAPWDRRQEGEGVQAWRDRLGRNTDQHIERILETSPENDKYLRRRFKEIHQGLEQTTLGGPGTSVYGFVHHQESTSTNAGVIDYANTSFLPSQMQRKNLLEGAEALTKRFPPR